MKRIVLWVAVILMVLGVSIGMAKDYEMTKKAGDLSVLVKLDKNPPVTGINKIDIAIKDASGKEVTDATVAIDYGMPAMPGMGAMNYKTDTSLKKKSYQANINFSMSGPWFINIKINRGSATQTVKLNVDIK